MPDDVLVLPLDDPAADLATVSGKGASLARLVRAGLPVPPGFHITTSAYRAFVAAGGEMPPRVASAILAAYREGSVAVRSSATAEDLPDLSFAGQHDTFLNVTGPDALLDAVARCWASLSTDRAVAYRAYNGVDPDGVVGGRGPGTRARRRGRGLVHGQPADRRTRRAGDQRRVGAG